MCVLGRTSNLTVLSAHHLQVKILIDGLRGLPCNGALGQLRYISVTTDGVGPGSAVTARASAEVAATMGELCVRFPSLQYFQLVMSTHREVWSRGAPDLAQERNGAVTCYRMRGADVALPTSLEDVARLVDEDCSS